MKQHNKTGAFVTLTFGFFLSSSAIANSTENQIAPSDFHEPVFPMFLGAALITWGAYDLSSDSSEGRRNVAILWGGALAASAGIILYQSSHDKGAEISILPTKHMEPSVAFDYRF
jgi:peptidoglycan/LPS O-acetylase OafA/YrhL